MVPQTNSYHVFVISILVLCKIKENESEPSDESYHSTREAAASKFNNLLDSIANINEQRLKALKHYTELDEYNFVSGMLRHANDATKHPVLSLFLLNNNHPENNLLYEIFNDDDSEDSNQNIIQLSKVPYDDTFADRNDINKQKLRSFIDGVFKKPDKNMSKKKVSEDGDANDGEEIVRANKVTGQMEEKIDTEVNNKQKKKKKEKKKTSTLMPTKMEDKQVLRIWKSCAKRAVKVCTKACRATLKNVCKTYKCSKRLKKSFKRNCKSNCKNKFRDK